MMVGTIALTDVLALDSWEADVCGMSLRELLDCKRDDEWFEELKDSIRRSGFAVPILVTDRGFEHGCHRLAAAVDLGLKEIPYTDDPEIGWEETWPEGHMPESWPE